MEFFEMPGNVVLKLRITKMMAEKAAREFKRVNTFVEKFPIQHKVFVDAWHNDVSSGKYSYEVYLPNGRLFASVRVFHINNKIKCENRVDGKIIALHSEWKKALRQGLKLQGII